ncbi:hypothetical protein [Haloferula sp. A504]|uniref:hypothetical protein n=1 Tax=Haloferula sp. A504 TaxID=3373601 RepID=UPI0031CBBBBA|nr:hypothetical protein [Verrucomicrobiaceae bacterium E54]
MKEKQRQQHDIQPGNEDDCGSEEPSQNAQQALAKVASVDGIIDDILSSATTGNYLESIRQRGGQ